MIINLRGPRLTRGATVFVAAAVTASAVAIGTSTLAEPAAGAVSNDRGMFGSQDPTYDGVYRQGLAITGLVAVGRTAPKPAVSWLLRQQCANGAFQAYRADLKGPCPDSDPTSYSGPDSNSTALGAMALVASGHQREGRSAIRWLLRLRNTDGGFAYYEGGTSDANSTGLALAALNALEPNASRNRAKRKAAGYLDSLQLKCAAPASSRGLLSYVADPLVANNQASAQGALGLVTSLPAQSDERPRQAGPIACEGAQATRSTNVRDSALDGLQRALHDSNGLLPSSLESGDDPAATAQAAMTLAAAGRGKAVVRETGRRLRKVARSFTGAGHEPDAGALGTLLLFAASTDRSPKHFGGVNLVKALNGSMR